MSNVVSLSTLDDLNRVITLSEERPVFIYKHSSICPICSRTYRIYHQYADTAEPETGPFFAEVFVIEHRDVSNAVAQRLNVMHQSPQLLLISEGRAVWDTSHFNITKESMDSALSAT